MAMSPPARVRPEVLRWARESIGYDVEDAAARIGVSEAKLAEAEQGERLLTLRQAEKAASVYERPFAALFLPAPPHEEPQEAQFRRLPGAPRPPWPPEMAALSRRVRRRQDAAAELYDLLDEESPWPSVLERLPDRRDSYAGLARELLGIGFGEQSSWRDQTGYTPLRSWIDAAEGLGVLVMQDGTMPVEQMRGFAATHELAPAIVVNTQDDARARAFTVLHELGHLWLGTSGEAVSSQTEEWCNDFAGEVLLPTERLVAVFDEIADGDLLDAIDEVALTFGVTPYAAAVRVARASLISQEEARDVIEEIGARPHRAAGGGGNYYRTQIGRLGPSFIRLVFSALDSQALTYPAASSLLNNVKVNNFEKLRSYLERRADTA